jgi:hypothetical protein
MSKDYKSRLEDFTKAAITGLCSGYGMEKYSSSELAVYAVAIATDCIEQVEKQTREKQLGKSA